MVPCVGRQGDCIYDLESCMVMESARSFFSTVGFAESVGLRIESGGAAFSPRVCSNFFDLDALLM